MGRSRRSGEAFQRATCLVLTGWLSLALLVGCGFMAPERPAPVSPALPSPVGQPTSAGSPATVPPVNQQPSLAAHGTMIASGAATATAAAATGQPLPRPPRRPPGAIYPTRPSGGRPTPTPEAGRYLGREPLPAGVDLTNGPFLKEMQARGAAGFSVGDNGIGDAIQAAYLAAIAAEQQALANLDGSRLPEFFLDPALADLEERLAEIRAGRMPRTIVLYQPRVMAFITIGSGLDYWLADARTETITPAGGQSPATPGAVSTARECYIATLRWENGRWLVQTVNRRHGGARGKECPPGWS